jgi:hypothetical protein
MLESEFVGFVSSVGFPIALSIWFMVRTEKVIKNNTDALNNFNVVVQKCRNTQLS